MISLYYENSEQHDKVLNDLFELITQASKLINKSFEYNFTTINKLYIQCIEKGNRDRNSEIVSDIQSKGKKSEFTNNTINLYCEKSEQHDKVLNNLSELITQDRKLINKLFEYNFTTINKLYIQCIEKGNRDRNSEIVSDMRSKGKKPEFIIEEIMLSYEGSEQLLPNGSGSPSSLKNIESSPEHGKLIQTMSSSSANANANLASGTNSQTTSTNPGAEIVLPTTSSSSSGSG